MFPIKSHVSTSRLYNTQKLKVSVLLRKVDRKNYKFDLNHSLMSYIHKIKNSIVLWNIQNSFETISFVHSRFPIETTQRSTK